MTLSTSDVRALVNEIKRLGGIVAWVGGQARTAHLALIDHDVRLADECTRRICDATDRIAG